MFIARICSIVQERVHSTKSEHTMILWSFDSILNMKGDEQRKRNVSSFHVWSHVRHRHGKILLENAANVKKINFDHIHNSNRKKQQ